MSLFSQTAQEILTPRLERLRAKDYSDVRDGEGRQYVDLVLQGGGMLGFALLGYTYALEQCGIRFWNIAGTSVGAVTSGLLAALGDKTEEKSGRVLEVLAGLDLSIFLDGNERVVELIRKFRSGQVTKFDVVASLMNRDLKNLVQGLGKNSRGWYDLVDVQWRGALERLGLNPGDAFFHWTRKVLRQSGISTTRQLRTLMASIPPGLGYGGDRHPTAPARLAVVAFDVTTKTRAIFPEHAGLYWANPDDLNPAHYIRASMAIPLFFEPLLVRDIPQNTREQWRTVAYHGKTPKEVMFVDGGIASNFPIHLFHSKGLPARPTFGAKLGYDDRLEPAEIRDVSQLMSVLFYQARNSLDDDFLRGNPDYRELVSYIDTKDHDWLDFDMPEADKVDLFRSGVLAAVSFLESFNWSSYKEFRRQLEERRL